MPSSDLICSRVVVVSVMTVEISAVVILPSETIIPTVHFFVRVDVNGLPEH